MSLMTEPAQRTHDLPLDGLDEAIVAARAQARRMGRSTLLRFARRGAPPHPVEAFRRAHALGQTATVWFDPARKQVFAAVGTVDRPDVDSLVHAQGVDARWANNRFETAQDPGPRMFFGAAFTAGPAPATSLWGDWPRAAALVPAVSICDCSTTGERWLAVQHPVGPDEDIAAAREAIEARWLDALLTVDAPHAVHPAPNPPAPEESAASWHRRVADIVEACQRGPLRKVVPARAARFEAGPDRRFDPTETIVALVERQATANVFGFTHHRRAFVGATPEVLARTQGRRLETHALAGTAPRDPDPRRDAELGASLLASAKDQHEHRFVVDAITGALDPLAEAMVVGSAPGLRRLSNVQHLETPISARLRAQVGLLDVVDRLHPTPALGGAPQQLALDWLARTEPLDRGWYGAPIGWLGRDGEGLAAVAIRSALIEADRAWAFIGAGVVADSDPAAEWHESTLKMRTIGQALRCVPRSERAR